MTITITKPRYATDKEKATLNELFKMCDKNGKIIIDIAKPINTIALHIKLFAKLSQTLNSLFRF